MLKKLSFVLAIAYTTLLTIASLGRINEMPKVKIDHADKWFHFIAYGVLSFLWFSAFYFNFKTPKHKALLIAVVSSILFGILIEVLQGTLTNYRSLDVYDAVANSIGALLTGVLIVLKQKIRVKNS